MVRNPPAMQENWVQSLGWEDPMEEGMAIHSTILAWRTPMNRGAWQATVRGVAKSRTQLSDSAKHKWSEGSIFSPPEYYACVSFYIPTWAGTCLFLRSGLDGV